MRTKSDFHGIFICFLIPASLLLCVICISCTDDSATNPVNETPPTTVNCIIEQLVTQHSPGVDGALTYDSRRDAIVYVGGQPMQTWEWSENQWSRKFPAHQPPLTSWIACRYFPDVEQSVLLCQRDQTAHSAPEMEMWFYDGLDWQHVDSDSLPDVPHGELVYDPVNRRLLYSGVKATPESYYYVDFRVWAFDGQTWSLLTAINPPSHYFITRAFGFDEGRGRLIMVGYYSYGCSEDGTGMWEYDGQEWIFISFVSQLFSPNMVYDRAHQQLLGIVSDSNQAKTTVYYLTDGEWAEDLETDGLTLSGSMTWHDGRHGIFVYQMPHTMELTEERSWIDLTGSADPGNGALPQAAFLPSSGLTLVTQTNTAYNNRMETWGWNGEHFNLLDTSFSDQLSSYNSYYLMDERVLATVPAGNGILMYIPGYYYNGVLQTWLWENDHWSVVETTVALPDLSGIRMCPYPPGQSVILCGWKNVSGVQISQTWSFSNGDWTKINTPNSPPGRSGASMVYYEKSRNVVMFGGEGEACLNDTWSFDGTDWHQIETKHAPPFRSDAVMAYDVSIDRIIVAGGHCDREPYHDVWTFDGFDWQKADVIGGEVRRFSAAIAFDSIRNRFVIWAGQSGDAALGSLLELSADLSSNDR